MKLRKIGSILLLACFVCQVLLVPVYLWFQYQKEANFHTSSLQSFENPEILELKVAMALPYSNSWNEAKESEGLFEYQGDFYTLINRHFENDTLYFKYLKNNNAREIFGLLADHAAIDTPDQESAPQPSEYFLKWFGSKYISFKEIWNFDRKVLIFNDSNQISDYLNLYTSPELVAQAPPPKIS